MNLKKPKVIEPRISRKLGLLRKRSATVESCELPSIQHFTLNVVVLNLSGLGDVSLYIIC